MKTFPHLFAKLFCQPVLITSAVRSGLEAALLGRMGMVHAAPPANAGPFDDDDDDEEERHAPGLERIGNVGVIRLEGVIDKHISGFEKMCYGGADLADFDRALQQAAASPRIERVVLSINSPGGTVTGVPESAARVAALTAQKEVHAFVDAQACSAAYWIAAQADHIAVAPSAYLGSIGVYMALLDETRALEIEGYKVELIKAGKYKAMGASFKSLTAEEREILQESVTELHQDFRAAVRSGRRAPTERGGHQSVADATMEGQSFAGKACLENRLADELTNANLDEYVAALL